MATTKPVGAIAAPAGHQRYTIDTAGVCTCACGYVAEKRMELRTHYDFVKLVADLALEPEDMLAWCERQLIAMAAGKNETGHDGEVTLYGFEMPIAKWATA